MLARQFVAASAYLYVVSALSGASVMAVMQGADDSHKEFNGFLYQNSSEIPRAYYGNVTIKF
jgi:hypothetical protein